MEQKIRILGIAPYEGMKALMSSMADEYPQVDLTLFVGDMEQGLEIAKNNFHGNYDVVISRGGTARMLQKNISLPVVEIQVSLYDLLCALHQRLPATPEKLPSFLLITLPPTPNCSAT